MSFAMAFDQNYAGNGDWQFPSPQGTPTAGSFHNVLQTPKTAAFHSHFQDAFRTPQMPVYSTPQQPHFESMAHMGPSPQAYGCHDGLVVSPAVGNQYTPGHLASGTHFGHAQGIQNDANPMTGPPSFSSIQMQTPPPTRGFSAKKAQQPDPIAFGTPSTIASRRFMTPQLQAMPLKAGVSQHTPVHFPQLQFSPELYQFRNLGPASAPVMPQTQLLWDQMAPTPAIVAHQRPLDDPFAPAMQQSPAWPASSPNPGMAQTMSFDTPAMTSFSVQPPHPRPASAASVPSNAVASYATTLGASSASLDPSLIYSSPIRSAFPQDGQAVRPRAAQSATNKHRGATNGAMVFESTATAAETITPQTVSGGNLRWNNTTGNVRPQTAQAAFSTSDALYNHPVQTASPLKRSSRLPLGSISEHKPRKRASVILTVDQHGIARTERNEPEGSPTKSIREKYPGLFDSDSSDNESDTSSRIPGADASMSIAESMTRRSKVARLDPPVENLVGLNIPRSGSSASLRTVTPSRAAIAAAASLRKQGSLRRPSRTAASKRNSMAVPTTLMIDSCPMGDELQPDMEIGIETKRIGGSSARAHSKRRDAEHTALDAHNRRWSMMSFEHLQPASIPTSMRQPSFQNGSRSHTAPLIRCICGVPQDHGVPLVQCCSCTQWLHSPCVCLDGQDPPPLYTCFLCTKPTSALR
ncbi:hypothetical protein BAUCODRAFT_283971 [Baudoinia panamericana UAMH 10762]|uniref:Zinc finger PHD-type domain-containing protein n=1 Tax=Baudoinia panamericana (strain UAMH 10762) TaxID=717646 RepID=M2N020_BAUPA|nr:uncharacterized protein BAUCODRAFT_283971 [Baudoinia panamericana UAMH 10762]EMC92274.1 hypothetical protein BAUCODRAFT_283971 [Baudoinia panamericana UAMH 10762]